MQILLVIGWGGTYGSITEAVTELEKMEEKLLKHILDI